MEPNIKYIPDKTGNYMRLHAMNRSLSTGGPSRTYDTAAVILEIQNEKSCQESLRLPGSLVNTSELLKWNYVFFFLTQLAGYNKDV